MEIFLVRHTAPAIDEGICYGQSDLELATHYKKEIEHTCSLLPTDVDMVFSSPLIRCQELASRISNKPIFDSRLMELNFGDWELEPWDSINKNELDRWMNSYIEEAPPNGESFVDLFSRVDSCFDEILSNNYSKVVIVCHAGVIRSILSHILNLKLEDTFKVKVDYGSVTCINVNNDNFQLVYSNRV